MTWTRLDDGWTDRQVFEALPHDVRWHYLCLIQFCSRNHRYDGTMRRVDALRCSDVDDPAAALLTLAAAELVQQEDGIVRLPLIEEHIPPPSMRDERRKERQRAEKRRSRLHRGGNHVECLPDRCPHAVQIADVSIHVSTDAGTGRDGPGRDVRTHAHTREDRPRNDGADLAEPNGYASPAEPPPAYWDRLAAAYDQ